MIAHVGDPQMTFRVELQVVDERVLPLAEGPDERPIRLKDPDWWLSADGHIDVPIRSNSDPRDMSTR